jgi:MOSC domain-containing protein YiiM
MPYQLIGLQTAKVRKVMLNGCLVPSAMHKTGQEGVLIVGPPGLEIDEQADLSVHGGLEKAVYTYPSEHYDFWRAERQAAGLGGIDASLNFGALGENLTLQGLLESEVWVGDELHFANCRLRVTQPREPCSKFNAAMGFNTASKRMAQSGYCGFYLAVDQPGTLQAGESFTLVPGPRRASVPERFAAKMFKHLQ